MRYVLLKMDDDKAEKLVRKAGDRAVGVWDMPRRWCQCTIRETRLAQNWTADLRTGRPQCKICGGIYKPLVPFRARLFSLFGRNILKDLVD